MKSLLRRLGHCDPRKVGTPSLTQCLGCHGGLLWRPDTDLKSRQVLRSSTQMKSVHHSVVSNSATLWTVACQAPPSKNIGVGSHSLLWGIFPTQGSNLGLLHCRWILYHLSNQDSPGEGQDEEGRWNYEQHTERKRGLQVLVIWPRSFN